MTAMRRRPGRMSAAGAAVLAHERAHLAGHYALLVLARIGRLVLPFLPLMRDADAQVARLAEMHADDAATRACDPRSLATALVALATAACPAPALAAAATDSVQRIHRLLGPPEPLGRARRQRLRAAAAALALTAGLLALTPAVLALARGRLPAASQTQPGGQPAPPRAAYSRPVPLRDARQQRQPSSWR